LPGDFAKMAEQIKLVLGQAEVSVSPKVLAHLTSFITYDWHS